MCLRKIEIVFYASGSQTGMILLLRMLGNVWKQYVTTGRNATGIYCERWKSFSLVRLFASPWPVHSVEFSRPEYWSGWPFPSAGDLPNPRIVPGSPALQVDSWAAELPGKPGHRDQGWCTTSHRAQDSTTQRSQRRASVVPRVKAGQALEHKHWGEAAAFLESFEVSSLFLSSFPPTLSSSSLPPPLSFLPQVYIYTHTSFLLQSGICLDRMTLGNKRILHLSLLLLTL